jgi:hypothetical protein
MKRREKTLLVLVLTIIAGTAGGLQYLKSNQRLGEPGVKSAAVPGTLRRDIELPREVPGYEAEPQEVDKIVVDSLPADTSLAQMIYKDAVGQQALVTVVMMGTDRTSIHQPQFCLTGQGWVIDESRSARATVHLDRPVSFDLPVMKLVASRTVESNGQRSTWSGIYVYWFVAHDAYTEDHWRRMWWMAEHLVRDGELQRWAYISYFMPCQPGQEATAFERIQKLMQVTVPDFQAAWPAKDKPAGTRP